MIFKRLTCDATKYLYILKLVVQLDRVLLQYGLVPPPEEPPPEDTGIGELTRHVSNST